MADYLQRLRTVFHPVKAEQAHFFVHEQLTFYRDVVKSYVPNTPTKKKLPGMEAHFDGTEPEPDKAKRGQSLNREQNQADAQRKAITRIKDYAKWNQFELFATFNFKADRQDNDKCFTKITNWFKNEQKKQTTKIEYLFVPEYHKDGESLHFHALIKGYEGDVKLSVNPLTNRRIRQKGRQAYEFPSFNSGYTNIKKIGNTATDHAKVGSYVSKYLVKDIATFIGKQRYRVSKGLQLPPKQDNPPPDWDKDLEFVWSKTNEYGTTSYYKPREAED